MFRSCFAVVLFVGLSWPEGGAAHHDGGTNRVSIPRSVPGVFGSTDTASGLPVVHLGSSYGAHYFGRVLDGSEPHAGELGTTWVQSLTLAAWVELATRTRFGAHFPAGSVTTEAARQAPETALGFGDAQVFVDQELVQLFSGADAALQVRPRLGLVLPTGRYERESALSLMAVVEAPDGNAELVSYDTRASLGSGSLAGVVGSSFGYALLNELALQGDFTLTHPLEETPDEIRWGSDLQATLSGVVTLAGRFGVEAGPDLRWHGHDTVPLFDDEAGTLRRGEVGGRTEFGAALGLFAELGAGVRCSLRGHLPLWQDVGGIQLVESFGVGAACAVRFGLGR